jgi:hypothetical protein
MPITSRASSNAGARPAPPASNLAQNCKDVSLLFCRFTAPAGGARPGFQPVSGLPSGDSAASGNGGRRSTHRLDRRPCLSAARSSSRLDALESDPVGDLMCRDTFLIRALEHLDERRRDGLDRGKCTLPIVAARMQLLGDVDQTAGIDM